MRRFAALYDALDMTTSTNAKIDALVEYFAGADPANAAWAIYFLTGEKLKRLISSKKLRLWVAEYAGHPDWLVEEAYAAVGDSAECVALLADKGRRTSSSDVPLARWVEDRLLSLRKMDEAAQHAAVTSWWDELHGIELFLINKLMSSSFRVGVSKKLVVRALAKLSGIEAATISHRLMGHWEPTPRSYRALFDPQTGDADASRPYPFFLASPLEKEPAELGEASQWRAEWKWDGIRGQVIKRAGEVYIWSRGEELVTARYPEVRDAALRLPDGVALDGELLGWDASAQGPLPFAELQRRIGRKRVGKKLLKEVPVAFVGYDLMESGGEDWRERSWEERRARLEALVAEAGPPFRTSVIVEADGWEALAALRDEARERRVEGLMLKRLGSPYRTGRVRGDWWKWKIDPLTIDAVMIYAQAGSGRRANLHTDYTLAVWKGDQLVPVAKAYSGLTDAELRKMDHWIRRNTLERFGPVRRVEPAHVFEIGFEGIRTSTRHKSGVAFRFPRILRWRTDKPIAEANTLEDVLELLDE